MYVLQHHDNGVFTFTPYTYLSDLFHALRTEYGLSESEYHECMVLFGMNREGWSLYWFQGEIPQVETFNSKAAAEAFQSALKAGAR
jgi:hypothetical protein